MREKFNAAAPYTNISKMKDGEIVHLPTGVGVTKDQMMKAVESARVIYITEQHDNIAAHEAQLEVIRDLYEKRPGKIAVGMEMFRRSVQPALDLLEQGSLPLEDFNALFDHQWTADWRAAYQGVLDYIHEKSILVVGLKPTRETEAAVRCGKTAEDVPELDVDDPHHRARYLPFFSQAGVSPEDAEKRYRMMVLWDEAMAETVAEFLQNPDNADKQLVVIAGVGHIGHGFGIPKRAFRREPHAYAIIAPTTGYDMDPDMPLPFCDYAWKVPYDQLGAEPKPKPDAGTAAKPPQPYS